MWAFHEFRQLFGICNSSKVRRNFISFIWRYTRRESTNNNDQAQLSSCIMQCIPEDSYYHHPCRGALKQINTKRTHQPGLDICLKTRLRLCNRCKTYYYCNRYLTCHVMVAITYRTQMLLMCKSVLYSNSNKKTKQTGRLNTVLTFLVPHSAPIKQHATKVALNCE